MPRNSHSSHSRHGGSSSDDLGSTDEVKIFKDEGDREEEKISSENLLEEKSSLIDLTESEEKSGKIPTRPDLGPVFNKLETHPPSFNMGYLVSPYSYSNGGAGGLPVTMANKIGLPSFFCHSGDPLSTPPPAHCGIPLYQLDPKAMGLTRPAIYPFPSSQYSYPMLGPDMTPSWHTPSVYSAASSFRSSYPSSLPINTTLSSDFPFRFSPNLLPSVHTSPHHVLNTHPAIVTPGPKQDCGQDPTTNHRYSRNSDTKVSTVNQLRSECKDSLNDKKKAHVKKPLNAFMLYMKEMRAKVVAECTLKESAAINQILGRRWHELSREEQSKYYEKARQERQLHMELYPGWSARDNYGYVSKKKKRKKDRSPADSGGNNMKKCRARFGLDQQNQWCKPCRRKKKCIRYMEAIAAGSSGSKDDCSQELDDLDDNGSDDNLCSPYSVDDYNKTPDDDTESLNRSLSSPGGLSGLSSLQSPSTSLASPLNPLAIPAAPGTIGLPLGIVEHTHEQSAQGQQQSSIRTQQQLLQSSGVVGDVPTTNQKRLQQQSNQSQLHGIQKHAKHHPHAHSAPTLTNNSIFEHSKVPRHFHCSSIGSFSGDVASVAGVMSIANSLTNTSSSSTVAAAAFTERTMRTLLNPSPSHLLLNSNCYPPSNIEPSGGTIVSIAQMLSNTSNSMPPFNANNSKSNSARDLSGKSPTVHTITGTSNGYNAFSSATNLVSHINCDIIPSSTSTLVTNKAAMNGKSTVSSTASSAASSPAADNSEKSYVATTHRNPVGANPHDINNPLSINQLTKCGENTTSSSSYNTPQIVGAEDSVNAVTDSPMSASVKSS